jgi:hypothetical protein
MASDLDEKVNKIVDSGNLGAVVQCGGRGRRAQVAQPKPLAILTEEERPITNVITDMPVEVPLYLHLLREHREVYVEFLNPLGNLGHRISYLIQQEGRLLDEDRKPLQYSDGTQVTASNGSATFIRHFVNPPEFLALIDGAKPGVYFPDITEALKLLVKDESLDAVIFARGLADEKMTSEMTNHKVGHTRYARLNASAQRVYEHPHMPTEVICDKEWLALAGMYIVRSSSYMKKTARMKGSFMKSESMNSLFEGFAYHLKLAMTLFGYNGRLSGLNFETFTPTLYIPGIKTPEDIERYAKLKQEGLFDYRRQKNA